MTFSQIIGVGSPALPLLMLINSYPALVALHGNQRSADTDFRARIVFGVLAIFTLVGFVGTNNILLDVSAFVMALSILGSVLVLGRHRHPR